MSNPITPDPAASYPIGVRNRVERLHERARYDRSAVWAVLDASMLCHGAYVIDCGPHPDLGAPEVRVSGLRSRWRAGCATGILQ